MRPRRRQDLTRLLGRAGAALLAMGVVLEAPVPASAYVFPLLGIGLVGLAEWWLVRRVRH